MSPAQRGARLLRALGCSRVAVNTLVGEVCRWRAWGSLDEDDLWAVAVVAVWQAVVATPDCSTIYLRQRVRWHLRDALNRERRSKGWRPRGNHWDPPYPAMAHPEWDWGLAGRPFRRAAA